MKEWRIEMAKKSLTRRGLKIIVVGCGKVGETLTDQLTREGHEVTLIDKDPTKVHDLTNMYDVMGIVGTGASYSVQMEAGIESADLLIAVTQSAVLYCCKTRRRLLCNCPCKNSGIQ